MLAAIERPPAAGWELRAWLAGVLRNRNRLQMRRERRRREREQARAAEGWEPSASAQAEQLDLARHILDAVHALQPAQRQVVLLRYFEGLPPREISARLRLPVNTVRSRLRRAIRQLRAKLDRQYGARSVWVWVLVPQLTPPPTPVCGEPKPLAVGGAGATLCSGVLLLAAAVGVSLLPGAFSQRLGDSDQVVPVTFANSRQDRMGHGPANRDVAAGHAPVMGPPRLLVKPEAAPFLIRGTVLDAGSRTLAGVDIRARMWVGFNSEDDPEREHVLCSDANGRFCWRLERPTEAATVEFFVDGLGYESWPLRSRIFRDQVEAPYITLRVVLLDCVIVGRVLGAGGLPVAAAQVGRSPDALQDCNGDGSFSIPGPSNLPLVYVFAKAPGYAIARVALRTGGSGSCNRAQIQLRPRVVLQGRVRDGSGNGIAGARVRTFYSHNPDATTDADGRYELLLDARRRYDKIFASYPGYARSTARIAIGSKDLMLRDLVLEPGVALRGHVFDEMGRPLSGAEVYFGAGPNDSARVHGLSRDDGSFELLDLPSRRRLLVTSKTGYAPDVRQLLPAGLSARVVLAQGQSVQGTVVDHEGQPLPGIRLNALQRVGEDLVSLEMHSASDASGRFYFGQLPVGPLVLSSYAEGYRGSEIELGHPRPEEIRVKISRAGSLAGRVLDARTGTPVESFCVRLLEALPGPGEKPGSAAGSTWAREGYTFSAGDGYWSTAGTNLESAAAFIVQASSPGYAPAFAKAVSRPEPELLVLHLQPEASIRGIVTVGEAAQPLEGALVTLSGGSAAHREILAEDSYRRVLARTGPDGRFQLKAGAGRLLLEVQHPTCATRIDGPFEVAPGGTVNRVIHVRAGVPN